MACSLVLLALAVPADAATGGAQPDTNFSTSLSGGATVTPTASAPAAPVVRAARPKGRIATAPAGAPAAVQRAIAEANAIVGRPYRWGGGHRSFTSRGYDCSGAVSYRCTAAACSTARWTPRASCAGARAGPGRWITVYTNPGHAFVEIAGLRLDTSAAEDPTGRSGPQLAPRARARTAASRASPGRSCSTALALVALHGPSATDRVLAGDLTAALGLPDPGGRRGGHRRRADRAARPREAAS